MDVIGGHGFDPDGVAYIDDLYLDFVMYKNGNILIDDRDELFAALRSGDITKEQFDLAIETQHKLLTGLLADPKALYCLCGLFLDISYP